MRKILLLQGKSGIQALNLVSSDDMQDKIAAITVNLLLRVAKNI